jgi:hypothetical protein
MLESVKGEGENFDQMIQELLEETYFDESFYQEIERRWRVEKRVAGRAVLKQAGVE